MRLWIAAAPLLALAALTALFLGFGLKHDPRVVPAALVGQPMPAPLLGTLDGGAPRPATGLIKGPALVNFFASWCGPCAEETPALMALKASGAPIVGIAYKDDAAAIRRFLAERGNPFAAVLTDPQGTAGVDFGVSGVPETFAVDARGRIVAKRSGALTPADAEALLERIGAP